MVPSSPKKDGQESRLVFGSHNQVAEWMKLEPLLPDSDGPLPKILQLRDLKYLVGSAGVRAVQYVRDLVRQHDIQVDRLGSVQPVLHHSVDRIQVVLEAKHCLSKAMEIAFEITVAFISIFYDYYYYYYY